VPSFSAAISSRSRPRQPGAMPSNAERYAPGNFHRDARCHSLRGININPTGPRDPQSRCEEQRPRNHACRGLISANWLRGHDASSSLYIMISLLFGILLSNHFFRSFVLSGVAGRATSLRAGGYNTGGMRGNA